MMTFLGLRPATVASPKRDRASAGYLSKSEVFQFALLADYRVFGEGTGEGDSLHSGQVIAMNYCDRQVASGSRGGALAAFPPPLYVKTVLIA